MNVVLVAGICVTNDAISNVVIERARLLSQLDVVDDVTVIAQHCNRGWEGRLECVADAWELCRHPAVGAADLVIFHWGIAYDLFDALPVVAAKRATAVHFHNVTPLELVDPGSRPKIERSLRQFQLAASVDTLIWTESEFNRRTLLAWGFDADRIEFVPFSVTPPRALVRVPREGAEIRVVTVGRLVPAKGGDVLLEAFGRALRRTEVPARLTFVGNTSLSDATFLDRLRELIVHWDLGGVVEIIQDADDERLWSLLERADVLVSPSRHEGLCVPVIEAYAAGCRVVASDAGNLPFVVQPPDPVVPVGDPDALADALSWMFGEIAAGRNRPPAGAARVVDAYSEASARAHLVDALGSAAQSIGSMSSGMSSRVGTRTTGKVSSSDTANASAG